MVSQDVTIAIVFGLIGALISLVGVVIACLTLRFMVMEKYERKEREAHEPILRLEHTHLFPLAAQQRVGQRPQKM
ncbi:hypothetical protein V8E51_014026 [Hyaloscypha variabilis]